MKKEDFIAKLNECLQAEDILAVTTEAKELKTKFDDFILEEERLHQIAQLELADKGEKTTPYFDGLNDTFFELYQTFRAKSKELVNLKKTTELECLKQKRLLLEQLKSIIQEEENISVAYNTHKDIQERWKNIGDIPRDKRQEIQQEYSRLSEQFFYNIKIYKELKDHDLHRNKQLKEAVIEKLDALSKQTNLKELETELKALQHEWDEIGPTVQSEWGVVKEAYWTRVKSIYDTIRASYDKKREEMAQNIEHKKELIEKVKAIIAKSDELDSHGAWQKQTEQLLEIQENWKKIGFGSRKENETIWADFRAICDDFFAKKKVFYDERKTDFDAIKQQKEALIEEARLLVDSTEWKETTDKILKIQERWKKHGNAGPKHEQKLWKNFREVCDTFFNNKKAFFGEKDAENETNLTKKQELVKIIEAYQKKDDKKATLADLKQFAQDFNAIGMVPFKAKDQIHKAFKTALDKHYESLDLKGSEKEKVLFQAKLATLESNPDSGKLLDQERRNIQKDIQKIANEIIQLENNIGFFGRSKGAEALKKEVEKKIEDAKTIKTALETKLRLIPR